MQEDRQVRFEAEHQRAPNAATIALTIATSSAEHSSSSFTPSGRWADSRASRVEGGERRDDSPWGAWAAPAQTAMTPSGPWTLPPGQNPDGEPAPWYPIGG